MKKKKSEKKIVHVREMRYNVDNKTIRFTDFCLFVVSMYKRKCIDTEPHHTIVHGVELLNDRYNGDQLAINTIEEKKNKYEISFLCVIENFQL